MNIFWLCFLTACYQSDLSDGVFWRPAFEPFGMKAASKLGQ